MNEYIHIVEDSDDMKKPKRKKIRISVIYFVFHHFVVTQCDIYSIQFGEGGTRLERIY